MSICLRYSKNRLEAREIMNEGFLKVFNKLNQYKKENPFHLWLRKILINTAIDYYRKEQRQPLFIPIENAASISNEDYNDFEIDGQIDTLPILQQLTPAYRIVFNLYVMEGFKHKEIAQQLGISESTSKTNLARAKQKLKQLIISREDYKLKLKENG